MPTAVSLREIEQLFQLEKSLNATAAKCGVRLHSSSQKLATKLQFLSTTKVKDIAENVANLLQNFETCLDDDIDPWNDREFFLLSMRSMGLIFPNDFLDNIGSNDLIEGYDMNRFQTFRNMRFMEISGYSLLEILASEWTALYDRPSAITEQMIGYCDQILWEANRTIPFKIEPHFIRELCSEERHVFEIKFKYLTPLFSGPNKPYGMLGNSGIKLIHSETATDNVAFI